MSTRWELGRDAAAGVCKRARENYVGAKADGGLHPSEIAEMDDRIDEAETLAKEILALREPPGWHDQATWDAAFAAGARAQREADVTRLRGRTGGPWTERRGEAQKCANMVEQAPLLGGGPVRAPETPAAPVTPGMVRRVTEGPTFEFGEPLAYPCDDNGENPHDLIIQHGGNGDWYVSILPRGHRLGDATVRLCTSGGASSRAPGLTVAIANAYRALVAAAGLDAGDEPETPREPNRWRCAHCGVDRVTVDDDGCCTSCGADAEAYHDDGVAAREAFARAVDAVPAHHDAGRRLYDMFTPTKEPPDIRAWCVEVAALARQIALAAAPQPSVATDRKKMRAFEAFADSAPSLGSQTMLAAAPQPEAHVVWRGEAGEWRADPSPGEYLGVSRVSKTHFEWWRKVETVRGVCATEDEAKAAAERCARSAK